MAHKHHKPGPVPPGNRPHAGPDFARAAEDEDEQAPDQTAEGAEFNDQDPRRRRGGYQTAGEHSTQQPGGKRGGQKKGNWGRPGKWGGGPGTRPGPARRRFAPGSAILLVRV